MKASWKFVAGLGAGFLLMIGLTVVAFYLNLGVPTDTSRWAFEVNQKKLRLARQAPSPKLLIVGGSASLFGISAREIQEQTGYRTINLGTHAALGTAYILHLVQEAAQPGDTVLLGFEYGLYDYGKIEPAWADKLFIDYLVARDADYFRHLSLAEQWNVFMLTSNRRLVKGLKSRSRAERPGSDPNPGIYSVARINEWGDQTGHSQAVRPVLRDEPANWKSALSYGLPEHPKAFPVIAAFCQWAQARQIRVLATFPNTCDQPEYRSPVSKHVSDTIKGFFAGLNVPVVGDYTDALLPRDQFFDTIYHPTEEAAIARTRRLAEQLRPYLK